MLINATSVIKKYVGETSTSLRTRANGHRFTIERKHRLSSLYTYLKVNADHSALPDYNRLSLGDYILIPIEQKYTAQLLFGRDEFID